MKKSILVGILLSTVMSASAQYPDLTDEAKKVIAEQKACRLCMGSSISHSGRRGKGRTSLRTLGWHALRPETGKDSCIPRC